MFKLKPDIVLRNGTVIKILDVKWKHINQNEIKKNYLLKKADMYQLFAYGKKYSSESLPSLFMIFPKQEHFYNELNIFEYDKGLNLCVIPFNLSVP